MQNAKALRLTPFSTPGRTLTRTYKASFTLLDWWYITYERRLRYKVWARHHKAISLLCKAAGRRCLLRSFRERTTVVAQQHLDADIADEFGLTPRGSADASPGHEQCD